MKDGIKKVIGKRIQGVVAAKEKGGRQMHIFFLFDDNTYFEVWSPEAIGVASYVDHGGLNEVKHYMRDHEIIMEASADSSASRPG